MKRFLMILYICTFFCGISMILNADTGIFGSYHPTLLAGTILCIFSGSYLGLGLKEYHRK